MGVVQLDMFMYLGESFEAIMKEHEIYPTNYDETMSSDDVCGPAFFTCSSTQSARLAFYW